MDCINEDEKKPFAGVVAEHTSKDALDIFCMSCILRVSFLNECILHVSILHVCLHFQCLLHAYMSNTPYI